jgi:hypothetical protein
MKIAKALGDQVVWHLLEKMRVGCSDKAEADREARLNAYIIDGPGHPTGAPSATAGVVTPAELLDANPRRR